MAEAQKSLALCTMKPGILEIYNVAEGQMIKKYHPKKSNGRPSDAFVYVLEGKTHYKFKDREYMVTDGDIMYFAKDSIYSIDILTPVYRFLLVNFDFVTKDGERPHSEAFSMSGLKGTEYLFRRMLEKWRMQKAAANEDCFSILYTIYAEIIRAKSAAYVPLAKHRMLDNALQYISDNLISDELSVENVARSVGMSESHFRRLFKSVYNVSPVRYICLKRIDRAKELILYTGNSLSQIATETGFSNLYYLSRIFKKEVGCTPSEFRKAHSEYQEF